MGIWDSICSGISSLASAALDGIKSIGSAAAGFAKSACTAFGQLLGGKAAALIGLVSGLVSGPLGGILGSVIGQLVIHTAIKTFETLAKSQGVIKEDDKTEELGYRIAEANLPENKHWKEKADFPSLAEYYAYLKEQIPDDKIDHDKLRRNRDRYVVCGMEAETEGIAETLHIALPQTFLFEAGKSRMAPEEIRAFADAFRTLGYDSIEALDYFKGRIAPGEAKRITEAIIGALKTYCKDKTEAQLYARLGQMQAIARDDNKLKDVYEKELKEIHEKQQIPEL